MRVPLRLGTFTAWNRPWTCRACAQAEGASSVKRGGSSRSQYKQDYSRESKRRLPRRRRYVLIGTAGTAAAGTGAGTIFFGEDLRHYYEAIKRSGRVVTTLYTCINDYQTTLKESPREGEDTDSLLKACHKRCAERTLRVLEKNGSIFIKLGQHLSSMGYLLPTEWVETFIPLQDKCPVSTYESIEKMFEKDIGRPLSDLFEHFDEQPVASASLAQVHRATMKDTGRKVAVKVQHPSLEQWVPLDMALTRYTFATLKRFFPEYDLEWLSDEMSTSLPQELNFTQEAHNAARMRDHFRPIRDAPLIVPDVFLAKPRILVMDYVAGRRPDDLAYLDGQGIDRDEVSAALARIFNEMIFGAGAPLHCDPHGGNIAVRLNVARRRPYNFDVILYDHGLYRDIPPRLKRDYARLWLAVLDGDEPAMRRSAKDVAGIEGAEFELFASAITGRDYRAVTARNVVSTRTVQEKSEVSGALGEGMLRQLVQLLGRVPRIILLILKTNDLTRSLDENLHTRQGPVRTFLILARYCSRTVLEEQLEMIREQSSSLFWPTKFLRLLGAWTSYVRVGMRLSLYEWYISFRGSLGLQQVAL